MAPVYSLTYPLLCFGSKKPLRNLCKIYKEDKAWETDTQDTGLIAAIKKASVWNTCLFSNIACRFEIENTMELGKTV